MSKRILATLVAAFALHYPLTSFAGYFEINGNGSYYKYDNGTQLARPNHTIVKRWGAGIAYRFLTNTSIEVDYAVSDNISDNATAYPELDKILYGKQKNRSETISLSLVLDFADKNSVFRPFIRGGGGYMWRSSVNTGSVYDTVTHAETVLTPTTVPKMGSALAEAGLGFKVYISNSTAIELTGLASASDLDKPEILLNYTLTGGLRFLFQ